MNTEEPRSKHWLSLCDILEWEFPKGKCQERGRALVLLAYAEAALKKEEKALNEKIKAIEESVEFFDPKNKAIPYVKLDKVLAILKEKR